MAVYKKHRKIDWDKRLDEYQFPLFNPKMIMPTVDKNEILRGQINYDIHQRRKMRILMKGIKVGVKKGGQKVNITGVMSKIL